MQVNVTFRHIESTEALKTHAREKVEHIQKFVDHSSDAHVVLYVENLDHHADITLKAGPFLLRGRARSEDMYASIDAAADKIEKQLKKHKEKLKNHKSPGAPTEPVAVSHEVFTGQHPSDRIVKSVNFHAKPMSLDEAVMQLEMLDSKFFVFQNAKDRAINIVYRRDDGDLGLIKAQAS